MLSYELGRYMYGLQDFPPTEWFPTFSDIEVLLHDTHALALYQHDFKHLKPPKELPIRKCAYEECSRIKQYEEGCAWDRCCKECLLTNGELHTEECDARRFADGWNTTCWAATDVQHGWVEYTDHILYQSEAKVPPCVLYIGYYHYTYAYLCKSVYLCRVALSPTNESLRLLRKFITEHVRELTKEAVLVESITNIPMQFKIWNNMRREKFIPVDQPARILPNMNLFIGDIDDAADVKNLQRLNIKAVVNLCNEEVVYDKSYYWLPWSLAKAKINQLLLIAKDEHDFNIIPVAQKAISFIRDILKEENNGVLIHCYCGVNRSGAVAAAYMTSELSYSLYESIVLLRHVRGTVLTNTEFIKQLVKHATQQGWTLK